MASIVSARGVVCGAALALFCLAIFLAGFVVKWVRIAWDAPAGVKGSDMEEALQAAIEKVLSLDDLWEHATWGSAPLPSH